MTNCIKVTGFYAKQNAEEKIGVAVVRFTSTQRGETISLSFEDECQITVAYERVISILNQVKKNILTNKRTSEGFFEHETKGEGMFVLGTGLPIPQKGDIEIWFRSDGEQELIGMSFKDKFSIFVPFKPIRQLVDLTREHKK